MFMTVCPFFLCMYCLYTLWSMPSSYMAFTMQVFMVPWGSSIIGAISIVSLSLGGYVFLVNITKHWLHSVLYFCQKHIRTIGLATKVKHIGITMISQREKDLLYSLSISSSFFIKLIMGASVTGGNFQRMELYFTLVIFISLNLDINLNLKNRLDRFIICKIYIPKG